MGCFYALILITLKLLDYLTTFIGLNKGLYETNINALTLPAGIMTLIVFPLIMLLMENKMPDKRLRSILIIPSIIMLYPISNNILLIIGTL